MRKGGLLILSEKIHFDNKLRNKTLLIYIIILNLRMDTLRWKFLEKRCPRGGLGD